MVTYVTGDGLLYYLYNVFSGLYFFFQFVRYFDCICICCYGNNANVTLSSVFIENDFLIHFFSTGFWVINEMRDQMDSCPLTLLTSFVDPFGFGV